MIDFFITKAEHMMRYGLFLLFFPITFLVCSEHAFREKLCKAAAPKWIFEQIAEDLRNVTPEILKKEVLTATMADEKAQDLLLVRYRIVNGHVSVVGTTPEVYHENLTRALCELMKSCHGDLEIPYCDFIVTMHDGPPHGLVPPILCFSKNRSHLKAIVIPDIHTLNHEKSLQRKAYMGNLKYPWHFKREQAFWRGATTGYAPLTVQNCPSIPRFQLVALSMRYPEWVDARFTIAVQGAENFKDKMPHYYGEKVAISEHLHYKYQILVDGNTSSWSRTYWQLFGNSVILKQQSDNIQWYYRALKPYVHYIPVARDFHDLISKLQWAKENDAEARKISSSAQDFARSHLQPEDQLYYLYLVLREYGRIQQS